MRIDVDLPADALDTGLRRLEQRLCTPGDPLHDLPSYRSGLPGLKFRHREADGEHFVYVLDTDLDVLAGVVVFNRLVELSRRAERVVRSPHARIAAGYRRQGIGLAVYQWALAQGICLLSGPRQSAGAHELWRALGRQHVLGYAAVRAKALHWLGSEVATHVLEDFHTRMVLLGSGWSVGGFCAETAAEIPEPATEG